LGGATLREKLVKISANVVRHGRHVTFQLAEEFHGEAKSVAEARLDGRNYGKITFQARPTHQNRATGRLRGTTIPSAVQIEHSRHELDD
jgi:hypothetical protein